MSKFMTGDYAYLSPGHLAFIHQHDSIHAQVGMVNPKTAGLHDLVGHLAEVVKGSDQTGEITVRFVVPGVGAMVARDFSIPEEWVQSFHGRGARWVTSDSSGSAEYQPGIQYDKPWRALAYGTWSSRCETLEEALRFLKSKNCRL